MLTKTQFCLGSTEEWPGCKRTTVLIFFSNWMVLWIANFCEVHVRIAQTGHKYHITERVQKELWKVYNVLQEHSLSLLQSMIPVGVALPAICLHISPFTSCTCTMESDHHLDLADSGFQGGCLNIDKPKTMLCF